jgi:hypothetical protein
MFGAMFWLIRYPFAEACGKKPAAASPCGGCRRSGLVLLFFRRDDVAGLLVEQLGLVTHA